MPATLQFEFRTARGRRRPQETTRLLLLGDFSARAHRGECDPASILRRPTLGVDVDTLDRMIARVAPTLRVKLDDGSTHELRPASLDDFHPDRLTALLPPLQRLAELRRRLLDPKQYAAAVAEVGAAAAVAAGTAGGAPASGGLAAGREAQASSDSDTARREQGGSEDDAATLERLLGSRRPAAQAGAAAQAMPGAATPAAAARGADALIRQALSGSEPSPDLQFQSQHVAALDAVATRMLRPLLHEPAFQTLEGAWRGVGFLVNRLDLGEELQLHLLDVSLEELRADAASAGEPASSALARRLAALAEEAEEAHASWGLAAGLYSAEPEDIDLLAALSIAARELQAPLVLGAAPRLAGICAERSSGTDPSEWQPLPEASQARWQSLRESAASAALGLVAPRFLLRLPYGRATDPITSFGFDELAGVVPSRSELLWGEAPLAALLVYARSLEQDAGGAMDIEDLPALAFTDEGERRLQPCAEWLIGERLSSRISDHGVMPLLGSRHRNGVRLGAWHALGPMAWK